LVRPAARGKSIASGPFIHDRSHPIPRQALFE
jgi:hypothetical protein